MDENVDIAYATQMRRQRPDLVIRAIGEPGIPPKQTPDRRNKETGFLG
jgi:hypothetical protein